MPPAETRKSGGRSFAAALCQPWLRLVLRLTLALALIPQGLSLLLAVQAPSPAPSTLLLRLGELARYRLLETFLGYSPGYQAFTGVAVFLGGALLLASRTTLLGALLASAALGMAALQQLLYAGPALGPSLVLLTLSLLLLAPDLGRLLNALVFNRPADPSPAPPLFAQPSHDRVLRLAFAVLGLALVAFGLVGNSRRFRDLHPQRPPFYGAWAVEALRVEGVEVPPGEDPSAWSWLAFDEPGKVLIERRIGDRLLHPLAVDEKARTFRLGRRAGSADTLAYSQPGPDRLLLDGRLEGRLLHAELRRSTLLSTPYHWPWGPEYEEE